MPVARLITAAISGSSTTASGAGPRGRLIETRLHLGDLVADARGLLVLLGTDGRVLVGLEVGEAGDSPDTSTFTPSRRRRRAPAWSIRSMALSGRTRSGR